MKKKLQQSYLVLSAKRFYPGEAVPADPALLSEELIGDNLRPIQKELSDFAAMLRKLHEAKRENIEKYGLKLTPKLSSKVSIVNSKIGRASCRERV